MGEREDLLAVKPFEGFEVSRLQVYVAGLLVHVCVS